MAALPGEALPNRSQTGLFLMLWPVFATSNLPMSASLPSRRSETVISPMAFRLRLVIFTERAHHAYRHFRGRLPCAVKAFGPHRGSEYALHLPGTAFGLLGVLLKGPLGDRHRLPPPRTVPHPVSNCLQIDLRECFDTAPQPTGTSEPSLRGEGGFWPVFGTATLPTGVSVASSRGEGVF